MQASETVNFEVLTGKIGLLIISMEQNNDLNKGGLHFKGFPMKFSVNFHLSFENPGIFSW